MSILIVSLLGYFIGSIPTAYLVLKLRRGIDITKNGSGNVGTLNSYEVSNSKKIGFFVLFIDLCKGIASVLVVKYFFESDFTLQIIALLFAVFGHCYSIWLKFKGGRGLATAAGGTLFFSPMIPFLWLLYWFIVHKWRKDIHLANIAATILIIISSILFADQLNKLTLPSSESNFIFGFSLSLLMLIILSKHIEPLKILLNNKRNLEKDEKS